MAVRLSPRPVFLAGRDDLLAELDARLAARRGPGPGMVVLSGLGGAGKTSVAVEYAHRQLAGCGVVWAAGGRGAGRTGGRVRGAGRAAGRGPPADGDPAAGVHAVLARRPDWLLVFDNVPGPAAIKGLVPPVGRRPGGDHEPVRVLAGRAGLEVPVLDRATAAAFLLARTGAGSAEGQAAVELAGRAGRAAAGAGAGRRVYAGIGRGLGEYLGLFRQRRAELLGRGEVAGYDKQVTTTWALAFAALDQDGPTAGLLRLAASCAAEDIPVDLLLQRLAWAGRGVGRGRWRPCWCHCWTTSWPGMKR